MNIPPSPLYKLWQGWDLAHCQGGDHSSISPDMEFKLHMLEDITNGFSAENKVGSGGFGVVYRGKYKGKDIAVKRLYQLQGLDDKEFENEYLNLRNINHENVVKLIGYCHESAKKFVEHDGKMIAAIEIERIFCFEYMPGGTLEKYITADSCNLNWPTCYKIIRGICEGLNHLHTASAKPILHLDIKPANILLDNNMNAKIADLGLSRLVTRTAVTNNVKGTPGYMPPEFQRSGCIRTTNDVFSLGVVILQLMDGNIGLARSREMSAEQFIEHVYGNWNKRLKEMPGHPSHESERLQLRKCVQIALNCVLDDRHQRPSTKVIVDELKQLEADDEGKDKIVQGPSSSSSLIYSSKKLSSLRLSDQPLISRPNSGPPGLLDVVIVYAFDCSDWTSNWYTVDDGVFWMVQEKLTHYLGSRMGYIYPMMNGNTYTSDMKLVDPTETQDKRYKGFARRRLTISENMASGLEEAHRMINNRGYQNGVILLFSDGLMHTGAFFDGAEEFESQVPVHAFTLGGDEYNKGLGAIAAKSPGGKFYTTPVPERPMLSAHFSFLLDSIFDRTSFEDENPPSPSSENHPLDVVLVYAFDCTEDSLAWEKTDKMVFWMVHKKLTRLANSCMGYIYPRLVPNDYTSDMKTVDPSDIEGYKSFARRRINCTKNMASGLVEANRMIKNRGYQNGIILFFSDGLINKGDFFDGTENFTSDVPVHTFTLSGNAYNHGLQAIAAKSGGTFIASPVPDRPNLSAPFSEILDSLLMKGNKPS